MISPVVLFVDENKATVVTDDAGSRQTLEVRASAATAEQLGRSIAIEIVSHHWSDRPVVIALASQKVFAGRFSLEKSIVRRETAVAYALEESFPLDAEEMLFRTIDLRDGTHFAVATNRLWLRDFFKGLGDTAPRVRAIIPASLIVVQKCIFDRILPPNRQVLLAKHPPMEIVQLQAGLPCIWHASAYGEASLRTDQNWSKLVESNQSDSITLLRFSDAESWMTHQSATAVDEKSFNDVAFDGAFKIVAGKLKPWIRFPLERVKSANAGSVSRNLLEAVLVSAILLGLMCTSAFLMRSWRMQKMAEGLEADKAGLAAKLFPDERSIRSPERLLQAEFDRLTRLAAEDEQFSQRVSALPMLYRFLEAYPASDGIEIATIQILPDRATVTGSVPSLELLDFLSQSLQAKGMRVEQTRYSLEFEIQLECLDSESPTAISKDGQ